MAKYSSAVAFRRTLPKHQLKQVKMAASAETCHKQVNPGMMIPGENLACVAVFSFPSGRKLKRTKASGKKEQRKTKTGEGRRKGRKWRFFPSTSLFRPKLFYLFIYLFASFLAPCLYESPSLSERKSLLRTPAG